jgi:predicted transcriptional regulator
MARALAMGGMENVQIISLDSAERVLTPRRREIIRTLRREEADSVRDLARRLDRDKAQVSRDLQVLAEHAVIHYETDGRAKAPRLTQEHVVVEPVV